VGVDLTPSAILMARAKTTDYGADSFRKYKINLLANIENRMIQARGSRRTENLIFQSIPNSKENSKWFHNSTLIELGAIWSAINDLSESQYLAVGQAAFSSILIQCCSQAKHWGWVCDNVQPKEFLPRNAVAAYTTKLIEYEKCARQLLSDAHDLQEERIAISEIKAEQGDCIDVLRNYGSDYFDLVVTSPPYYNVTDYIKSQRLSNLWLDVDTTSLKKLEIGARYKRGRLNGLNEYLIAMQSAMIEIVRVLKQGKFCCVVLGESPQHESYLNAFEQVCVEAGLEVHDSITRTISTSRRFIPSVKREKILIMKKK
jgi:hypothetical protein